MHRAEYVAARDTGDAIASAQNGGAFIAGGTTLVDLMKCGVEQPSILVDITALPLAAIEATTAGVRIGALATNSDVAYDATIRERFPALSQALLAGASPQLRNMATVGGNILQRTRCAYFRDPSWACNKRAPGSGCSAIEGYVRYHAILGTSDHCIAANPSDMNVALAALDAVVHISGRNGARTVPFVDLHLLPGDRPDRETVLEPGDIITAVEIAYSPLAHRSTYVKLRDRTSYAFALVSVAAAVELDGGRIREARIALGGVATKPWRASAAEALLAGNAPGADLFARAAAAAMRDARTLPGNAFKSELAQRAIVRALTTVAGEPL